MLRRLALSLSLFLGTVAIPRAVEAAPPQAEAFDNGLYVFLHPFGVWVPTGNQDFFNVNASFQWGGGMGYFLRPKNRFMMAFGGSIEHLIFNTSNDLFTVHALQILPQARIGAGNDRMFGYGLVSVGLALAIISAEGVEADTDAGAALDVGGGFQYMVWKRLVVGGELAYKGFFITNNEVNPDDCPTGCPTRGEAHGVGLRGYVGWNF